MATHSHTRRGILGAMALAPMVMSVPALSAPASVARSDFDNAIASFHAIDAAATDHDTGAYIRATDRCAALQADIPHETVQWLANDHFGGEVWSTADERQVKEARYFMDPAHKIPVNDGQADYHRACIDLLAAADRREAKLEAARKASGIYEAVERSDELNDLRSEAIDAVVLCPVSTATEMVLKIAFINEHRQWEFDWTREAVAADAACLPT